MADLGSWVLGREQFDADLVEIIWLTGGIQQQTQPEVKPDLARAPQRIITVRWRGGYQFEPIEWDAPEIIAEGLMNFHRRHTWSIDKDFVENGAHGAGALMVDHQW